jgi:type I restriction enzyme S subunit
VVDINDFLSRGANVSRTLAIIPPVIPELAQWLYLSLQAPVVRSAIEDAIGGTTRDSLNLRDLRRIQVPLPPLAEQKRIVAKVEELLARVNAARERLARVSAILKRFRQSVLAAACSGRLTTDWREEQGVQKPGSVSRDKLFQDRMQLWLENGAGSKARARYREPNPPELHRPDWLPQEWEWASTEQIAWHITKGSSPAWQGFEYVADGVPFVRSQNVRWGKLDTNDLAYVTNRFNETGVSG